MATDIATARIAATGSWGVLRGSFGRWLRPRGILGVVVVTAAINGILYMAVVTKNMPFGGLGYETLINMLALFPPLIAIIGTEAMMLGEHRSGVAAWTISKPVTRSGYVAGKLVGLWVGMSVGVVLIPGMVAYWWLPHVTPYRFVRPEAPPLGDFLGALGALCLVTGFFIMLTGLLATLLRRRGVVALIVLIGYIMVRMPQRNLWSDWDRFTPTGLISTDLNGWSSLTSLIYGEPFTAGSAVTITALASVAYLTAATAIYRLLEL